MKATKSSAGLLRREWRRLLDGETLWGSMTVSADRFGVTRYRLAVYPPGITAAQRRRVRVWRGWPMWGALLWIVAEILLPRQIGPWTALAVSTAAFIGSGIVAWVNAGEVRAQVRTMAVTVMAGYQQLSTLAARRTLQTLAATLVDADESRRDGGLSPVEYERIWWQVYDQMGSGNADAPGLDIATPDTR